MKIVIVYLIKGKAKRYQVNLINELSRKFRLNNLNKSIMPHLTLKYFSQVIDKSKVTELESVIKNFSEKVRQFRFDLSGFGNFDKEIVFMKASDEKLDKFYRKFTSELKKLEWVKWGKYEKRKYNLHSTLARVKFRKQFKEIERYLSDKHPVYELKFNNIAILKKPKNKWVVHKEFKIK